MWKYSGVLLISILVINISCKSNDPIIIHMFNNYHMESTT